MVEQKVDESCYEDREDLLPTPTVAASRKKEEDKGEGTLSSFDNIETIMYTLETEYGFDKFNEIYKIIKEIDEGPDGEISVDEYLDKLCGVIEPEKVSPKLYLFLSLKKIEQEALTV